MKSGRTNLPPVKPQPNKDLEAKQDLQLDWHESLLYNEVYVDFPVSLEKLNQLQQQIKQYRIKRGLNCIEIVG